MGLTGVGVGLNVVGAPGREGGEEDGPPVSGQRDGVYGNGPPKKKK